MDIEGLKEKLKADAGYSYIYAVFGIKIDVIPYELHLTYIIFSDKKVDPFRVLMINGIEPYVWGIDKKSKVKEFANFYNLELEDMDESEMNEFLKQKDNKEYESFYCKFEKKFHYLKK